jgi:alkylation response protein AidB-like acyl-CoA dehydrogenase
MDFSLSEEEQAVRDLARQILEATSTHERLRELEAGEERFDRKSWDELAKANLLGIALPEDVGGSGLGFVALAQVLEAVGRTTAMTPVLPSIVMGALPIAEFGTAEQKKAYVTPAIEGELVLTAALVEPGAEPDEPATTAVRDGDGWRLTGTKTCVPAGMLAGRILVPARTERGDVAVFILDPAVDGVTRERQETTSRLIEAEITMDGALVTEALGAHAGGREVVRFIVQRGDAAIAAIMTGVCDVALRMTAEYTKTREQFERPIATFQAVGQRAADAYVDTEAVRLTAQQAAWRLGAGLPAEREIAIAKFWASEGGQRVVHAAQHLHGGMGVDRDYPLHRYFTWARQLELTLGSETPQLLALGALMAAEPA